MKKILASMVFTAMAAWAASASAAVFNGYIYQNNGLRTGDSLVSPNGKYFLILQTDGHLVLYRKADMKPIWYNSKFGGTLAAVQGDANFVVYNENTTPPTPIWHTVTGNTGTGNDATLYLRDTGALNLVNKGNNIWITKADNMCPNGGQYALYPVCVSSTWSAFSSVEPACSSTEAVNNAKLAYPGYSVKAGNCQ